MADDLDCLAVQGRPQLRACGDRSVATWPFAIWLFIPFADYHELALDRERGQQIDQQSDAATIRGAPHN
jgi:hypothetical protein